jgi:hypothetical protein
MAITTSTRIASVDRSPQVWVIIAGAPASDKTEMLSALKGPHVKFVDSLTEAGFASAFTVAGKKASKDLLQVIREEAITALVIKDLSSMFGMREEKVRSILGDLCAIYDREFTRATGTMLLSYEDIEFAVIAASVEEKLDDHARYMSIIGPRFLFYRIPPLTREEREAGARKSWEGPEVRAGQRKELAMLVREHTADIHSRAPSLLPERPEVVDQINRLSELLSRGRGTVKRDRGWYWSDEDGRSKQANEIASVRWEEPFRCLAQLRTLARSLAVVHDRPRVGPHEVALLRKVALSTIHQSYRRVLEVSHQQPSGFSRADIERETKRSRNWVVEQTDDLVRLELLDCTVVGAAGKPHQYIVPPGYADLTRPWEWLDHILDLMTCTSNSPR